MVVCVGESRSQANAKAVLGAVQAVVKERRHDSLLERVKQCIQQCGRWPWNFEEKFPVVAEVKGLGQVELVMRRNLIDGLKGALGLETAKKLVSES